MSWFETKHAWGFLARFCLVLALLLAPLPWVADAYTTANGSLANAVLFVVDRGSRLAMRFEAPETLRANGSWAGILRIQDRQNGQTARMKLDVRAFSYRPIATFVALAVAARVKGRRAVKLVWGIGLPLMVAIAFTITTLAALRFGIGRFVGFGGGPVNETAYEALSTPAMAYAIPFFCFCALIWIERHGPGRRAEGGPAGPARTPNVTESSRASDGVDTHGPAPID